MPTATAVKPSKRSAKPAKLAPNSPPSARLSNAGLAALQCRQLRHAWPRNGGRLTELAHRGERCILAEIAMECTGECGTVRTVRVEPIGPGQVRRVGKPKYKYRDGYLFKTEATDDEPPPTADEVTYAALTLMYPGTLW